jgi:predicted TIM-barrel fold metal-dependent hydrolase
VTLSLPPIVDADGHVWEDPAGVIARLPEPYRTDFEKNPLIASTFLFPPLDHFHTMPARIEVLETRTDVDVGPAEWQVFLDEVGIERTVLYPTRALAMGQNRDPDFDAALAHAYNEWMSDTYVRHPSGRFSGVAVLPMLTPERAVAELRHAVEVLGMSAAMIPANGLPRHLGSREYWPVYAEAERLGCPISFHGGSHSGMGFDDLNVYAPVHALGHPFALLITLGGMVFNRVYERFPDLRTAYLEGGAAWVLLAIERFAESGSAFRPYNPNGEVLELVGKGVDEHLIELIATERIALGCEGGEHELARVSEAVGTTPFMYSSDYPHEVDARTCRHELEELVEQDLGDEAVAAILGGNARRFYGLPEPAVAT